MSTITNITLSLFWQGDANTTKPNLNQDNVKTLQRHESVKEIPLAPADVNALLVNDLNVTGDPLVVQPGAGHIFAEEQALQPENEDVQMEQINDEPEIQIPENEEDVQMEQIHDEPLENNVAQEEERLMDLADINAPLVGDILIADDPLQPEAGPANEELPEFNPNLRRSRRNLYPKHSKKMKQLLGLPTSDDEGI